MFTLLNYLFTAAFIFSAAVQYNDPDGLYWGIIYASAALLTLVHKLRWSFWPMVITAVGSLALTLWLLPQFIGTVETSKLMQENGMRYLGVEEAREAGGAMLVAFWMFVLSLRRSKRRA